MSACATTASESDAGPGGRRYEPCGGGPVFPPESPDSGAAPSSQEEEPD